MATVLATTRGASHWLFARLAGVKGVHVPDTALFDDEGLLAQWLHTPPANGSSNRPRPAKARLPETTTVAARSIIELNLLRLESRLQDLHHHHRQGPVAVLHTSEPPTLLTEETLDATVRELCHREQCLTSDSVAVPRQYPGGAFVLQQAVPSDATLVTEILVAADRVAFSHRIKGDDDPHALRRLDLARACEQAEAQSRAVLQHLARRHGVQVATLSLEFALAEPLTLTAASSAAWTEAAQRKAVVERGPVEAPAAARAYHRVCRQCRAPLELELSRELLQKQTLLRSVLAKHQQLSERLAEAEAQWKAAQTLALQQQAAIDRLVAEAVELRARVQSQERVVELLGQQKRSLAEQLTLARAQADEAKHEGVQAATRLQDVVAQQLVQLSELRHEAERESLERKTHDAEAEDERLRLQEELGRAVALNRKLQAQLDEMRAAGDELQLQWAYVVRKLTDVGERGVEPPKRVAGGFSSYPCPSQQNVEQVVKWLVDYEARRTVLEAQQRHRGSTSVQRRLRMKVELMRLLATGAGSPSRRRRRSSRSPHKKASAVARGEEGESRSIDR